MEGFDSRWSRREWRREWKRSHRHPPAGGFVFGLIITAGGTIMLLQNLGILHTRSLWDYAPLILVAIGLVKIVECQGRTAGSLFGGMMTAVGTVWFLSNIDVLLIDGRIVWPVLIIALGILFLVRALERQHEGGVAETPSPVPGQEAQINVASVFGGVKRFIDSPDFRSADLFACFGGIEIDFRGARIADRATIDANTIFGGIEIRVPRNWSVETKGMGIFGGFEDKTVHPDESLNGPAPRLTVTGLSVFGGVTVNTV